MKVLEYDNLILGERICGIEIVDGKVKVLELKRSRGRYSVVGFGQEEVDPNSISSGVIIDQKIVAESIRRARANAKPRRIKTKFAGVVLPDSKIFIRVVKFPAGMTKEDIREAVEWKAKDLIAMPLDKVYWDWHRLVREEEKNGGEVEVVISAVEKKCVDSFTQTLKLLNITPLYYDVSGNSAARFLFQKEYSKKKALLVRIDRSSTTLSLFLNGGVRYQTVITDVIKGGYSALVDFAASQFKVDKEKAERLVLYPDNLSSDQKALLTEFFEAKFDHLMNEIAQILDYYRQSIPAKGGGKKQEVGQLLEVFLYGKGARVFHLKEFFEQKSIDVKTDIKSTSSVSPLVQFISRQSLLENLVLLGLSLRNLGLFRELRDINLVPKAVKSKYIYLSVYNTLYSMLRVVFWNVFIIGVSLFALFLITIIYKANVGEELKAVENIAESQANKKLREDITYINKTAQKLDLLLSSQLDWERLFVELSIKRGGGISYKNILITEDPEAWEAMAGGKKVVRKEGSNYVVLNGVAETRDDLQRYVLSLEGSKFFEDIRVPIKSYEESVNIDFTVYCLLNLAEVRED